MKTLIKSPLPGKILGVKVSKGQEIKKGQVLVILESMKMHNEILCEYDALVTGVSTVVGDFVNINSNLVELEKL
jgi:biotin carboxyl carrier protein